MIKLLDCTLRDGGYINNWEFGYSEIVNTIADLENSNVDILELGFLKNEKYHKGRTIFNSTQQIETLIPDKKENRDYAAMIEVVNPIPLEMLEPRTERGIDIIRVIVWKTKHDENGNVTDALREGFEYCRGIVKLGYKLCVQPARVDQYSDEEFESMLQLFQQLNPMAIYIVDSWGTQSAEQILHYARLADKTLSKNIAIGYHGHNNLMQTFGAAVTLANAGLERDLIIDGSVYGIGRGAGNLNLEIFARYLNKAWAKSYNILPMIRIYENCVKAIYDTHIWGYCIPYFLTAQYNCNPNYGEYMGINRGLMATAIDRILQSLTAEDKVLYSKEKADRYISCLSEEVW